jgi:hypothetical protein
LTSPSRPDLAADFATSLSSGVSVASGPGARWLTIGVTGAWTAGTRSKSNPQLRQKRNAPTRRVPHFGQDVSSIGTFVVLRYWGQPTPWRPSSPARGAPRRPRAERTGPDCPPRFRSAGTCCRIGSPVQRRHQRAERAAREDEPRAFHGTPACSRSRSPSALRRPSRPRTATGTGRLGDAGWACVARATRRRGPCTRWDD